MTRRITLNLDLNENDLDALHAVLASPAAVAKAVAPGDHREQIRIVNVLAEIAGGVAEALGCAMADAIDNQVSPRHKGVVGRCDKRNADSCCTCNGVAAI